MLKLIPFKAEHATHFSTIDDRTARVCAKYGIGYTGIDDQGRIIFAAGILPRREGVGDAWAAFTPDVKDCKIATARTIINMMAIVVEEYGFLRIRAMSKTSRLVKWLGFERQRRDTISGYGFYVRAA